MKLQRQNRQIREITAVWKPWCITTKLPHEHQCPHLYYFIFQVGFLFFHAYSYVKLRCSECYIYLEPQSSVVQTFRNRAFRIHLSAVEFKISILNMIVLSTLLLFILTNCACSLQLRMGTGNTFGKIFRISTYGESHGKGVGVIVDGCPPRIPLTAADIQAELDRRRPGQSRLTTPRNEEDTVEILSGVVDGVTIGTPISLAVRNKDQKSQHYDDMETRYRPSHADATYDAKYGVRAVAGGGRSSARETIGRVAAGAIAKKILSLYSGVEIIGYVRKVQDIEADNIDIDTITQENVRFSPDVLT